MTTGAPGVPVPGGSYTVRPGQRWGQDETPDGVRQKTRNPPLNGYSRAQNNLHGPAGFLGSLLGAITGGRAFTLGEGSSHFGQQNQIIEEQAGSITGLDARVTALEGGGTRTVYSSNFVWDNPGSGKIYVAVFNGGQCGQLGYKNSASIPVGGIDGGYNAREFNCADLPPSVTCVVGAGGATNLQAGGQSSFGTYVTPVSGAPGAVLTPQGALASASSPGDGGNGAATLNTAGQPGEPSALATGGAAGNRSAGNINGQPGQSVPLESDVPCGGGGGGGGGTPTNTIGMYSGNGGAGGAPGGGGGASGNSGQFNRDELGMPGPGANGRIIITYTPGAPAT